ncbi:MAG: hypothetical protein PHQ23_09750 [Candidatus Wallbacteria bacterium]|nr:hypothetical protein [Candidatus Wallbacteria bacterium]
MTLCGYQFKQLAKLIPGKSDGLVALESAAPEWAEMQIVHEDHCTITDNREVWEFMNTRLFEGR